MWLSPYFTNSWIQDIAALVISFGLALLWLRSMDFLAHRGLIGQKLSRKIIHIGTGPIYILCWNFFSFNPSARYLAALIPLAITIQFFFVGMGWIKDPAAVQAMSRTGDRKEILRGPLYYGCMFILLTLIFWQTTPVGILALMILSGGDGFADILGRRFGKLKIPFSNDKSFMGSVGMLFFSFTFGALFVSIFNSMGYFSKAYSLPTVLFSVFVISLAATIVEAYTRSDLDNLTITLASVVLGLLLF